MNAYNAYFVAMILYIPFVKHFPLVLPLKGLNGINLMFLGGLIAVLAHKGSKSQMRTPLKYHFIFLMMALTWGFVMGILYDASSFDEDVTKFKTALFYPLLYFLFYHAARDFKTIRVFFYAIMAVAALVALQGTRQALDYGIGSFAISHRVHGPFATDYRGANLASAYFVIFIPIFYAVFLSYKSRPWIRLMALPAMFFAVFATFFTFSRQAYFILAVQFMLQTVRRNAFFAIFIIGAVASYQLWAPESVVQRLEMTEQEDASSGGEAKLDTSTESRFILWGGAMQMFTRAPWGVGLTHFSRHIGEYAPQYAGMDAHNGYVLITAEMGLLGLAAIVTLVIGLWSLARKVEKLDKSEDTQVFGSGYAISVVGLAACNLFGTRFFDGEVVGNFWILSALVARYYTLTLETRAKAAQAIVPPQPTAIPQAA
jgi:O-antigen ligase